MQQYIKADRQVEPTNVNKCCNHDIKLLRHNLCFQL